MDRLNELLKSYETCGVKAELVELLIAELNNRTATVDFLGSQLSDAREIIKCTK